MKRSEMIMELATELILNDIYMPYNTAQEIAEIMLSTSEKLGMLPPVNPELEASVPLDHFDAILDQVSSDFKWEQE